ncbi:MAG: hypothetical protein R3B72_29050 [Polyangiaceae bacterium]
MSGDPKDPQADPSKKAGKTLITGTTKSVPPPRRPSRPLEEAPLAKKASGKTLAGGGRGGASSGGHSDELLDEVTAEELIEEIPPPLPPSKAPPVKSRPQPPRNPSRRSPPRKPDTDSDPGRVGPPLRPRPPKPPLKSAPTPPSKEAAPEPSPEAASPAPPAVAPRRTSSVPAPPLPTPTPAAVAPTPAPLPRDTPAPAAPPPPPVAAPAAPSLERQALVEVCKAELTRSGGDAARSAQLHYEIGRASDDDAVALEHYKLALQQAPEHRPTIRAARALRLAKGEVAAAAALFDAELALVGTADERAMLLFQKGSAWLDLQRDAEKARKCFAEAVELAPDNPTFLRALEHVEIAGKNYAGLAESLSLEANAVSDDPQHRAAVLTARGRLLEHRLGKPEDAAAQLELALALDPRTPLASPELKRLLVAQGRWPELVAALQREAELTEDDDVRVQAHWEIARLQSERLENRAAAIEALETAAAIATSDMGLLEDLARHYEAAGNRSGAASALERLSKAVREPRERLAVYQRLAEVHDRPSGDARAAVAWYEAALGIDAGFVPAVRALDRLYAQVGNYEALAKIYVAEGEAGGASAKRAQAFARAAAIYDQHLARPDLAATAYARALALDETHEGAFKALVRLHVDAGRHHQLIELYDRAVDRATTEDVALTYLFKMGALYEDVLKDPKSAIDVYRRILARKADSLAAIHALQRVAEASGDARTLVDALDTEVKLESDRKRGLELELYAAETLADRLGEPEQALPRLESIHKRAPKHVATLQALARVYRALTRTPQLVAIYERQLDVTEDVGEQIGLLVTMAELAERELAEPSKAIKWYGRVVELDKSHALARAALTRLLRETGDHAALAKMLEAELQNITDPDAFARSAVLLGQIDEDHLGDPEAAVNAYRRALDAKPGHRPALDALMRVHGRQGDYRDLAETLALSAEEARDPRLGLEATLLGAVLRAERLGEVDEALPSIEAVASAASNNLTALQALERLHVERGDRDRLADILARQAQNLAQASARVAALVARGRILESQAPEHDADLRSICTNILAAEATNAWALEALQRLATRSADQGLLADVAARFTEATSDPALLADHQVELGQALTKTNPSAALAAFRKALKLAPGRLSAIRGLATAGAALGDASTMVESYRLEAEWRRDPEAKAALYVQSGAVLRRLGDRAGAIDDNERALAECPEHEPATEHLTALLVESSELDRLTETLSRAAHACTSLPRKVALWRRVGELHADYRRDLGAAISAVRRALEVKPNEMETLLQLAALHKRDAQHDKAAELLARAVTLDDANLDAHLELAGLYAEHLEEPEKAARHIDRVLRDRDTDPVALRLRLLLELDRGDQQAARHTSEALLAAAGNDDSMRAWALVEIGRSELAAGDHGRAAEALRGAVVLVGLDGEAAKIYGKLLGDKEPWDRYASALSEHIRSGRGKSSDTKRRTALYLELARVQHKLLDKPGDALRTIEQGIAQLGDSTPLALRRAELLGATGKNADALGAFQAITAAHPADAEAWRGLVRAYQNLGKGAEATIAAGALVILGDATDAERALAADRNLRPGAARPASFATPSLRNITAGSASDEDGVAGLFHALADALGKAFPIPYEIYGVRKGDRIKARTAHPIRQEIDALCMIFGIEDVDLYVHAGLSGDVAIELGDPPALMVPTYLSDLPEATRIFMLARPMAAIASGLYPAWRLGPEDTGLVLAAAVRRLVPTFEDGQHDMDRLAVLQDKLSPSWFGRGKVDEAVQAYYAQPVQASTWAPTVELTATRAAAILCGDLEGVVSGLRLAGAIPQDAQGAAMVSASPLLADVLRMWHGPAAGELRVMAGIV